MVEVLVAMVINVLLITALAKIFSSNLNNYNLVVDNDTLNQQLEVAMELMTTDIRRAGYWGSARSEINSGANNNPFQAAATDIAVNAAANCVLFAYDYNNDGNLGAITTANDDEHYGYRLVNSTLQIRPTGSAYSCTAANTAWDNVTNPNIVAITALSFTIASQTVPLGATSNSLSIRTVTISITGHLVANTSVTNTMTEQVRIRNDKFVP